MKIVILGLSITSSWGNGHAATYRGLARGLTELGHDLLFLERDVPWYASSRDMPSSPHWRTRLYSSLDDLKERFSGEIREADFVMVGSYVTEGIQVGEWVTSTALGKTGFYDIDTPITLQKLSSGDLDYLSPQLIPSYNIYLSFTGGPLLEKLERRFGARMARPLYCSVDPEMYFPSRLKKKWDLGYMGTYSPDRQPNLDLIMIEPARRWGQGRFIVAGPLYPDHIEWPANVERKDHVPPPSHREFYNSQRFTLNITRADMVRAGYSPSVRLFEAASCGVPIISDYWQGLDEHFVIGSEILVSQSPAETMAYIREMPDKDAQKLGKRAREKVLASHTSRHRAKELEKLIKELVDQE